MSKGAFSFSLTGETSVGSSEFRRAQAAELERMFGDQLGRTEMVVVSGADFNEKPGLVGRLIGHPAGYVGYEGDRSGPPEGLLATLCLARMEGHQPPIFLDDDFEPRSVK